MECMLRQYQLRLCPTCPHPFRMEWGYRLYAVLLSLAPPDFSNTVHQNGFTPISQYVTPQGGDSIWTINLLGAPCVSALSPVIEGLSIVHLEKGNVTFQVEQVRQQQVHRVEELFVPVRPQFSLRVCTPLAFKQRGVVVTTVSSRLVLQSLLKQWNAVFPACPIEDENGQGLDAMAQGVTLSWLQCQPRRYYLKGHPIEGNTGALLVENRLSGFHADLAQALFAFATFAGVGVKTTLGMGGVRTSDF